MSEITAQSHACITGPTFISTDTNSSHCNWRIIQLNMSASIATTNGCNPSKRALPRDCKEPQPRKKHKIAPCMCSDELAQVTERLYVLQSECTELRGYKQKYLSLKLCVIFIMITPIMIIILILISYREGIRTILRNEKRALEAFYAANGTGTGGWKRREKIVVVSSEVSLDESNKGVVPGSEFVESLSLADDDGSEYVPTTASNSDEEFNFAQSVRGKRTM